MPAARIQAFLCTMADIVHKYCEILTLGKHGKAVLNSPQARAENRATRKGETHAVDCSATRRFARIFHRAGDLCREHWSHGVHRREHSGLSLCRAIALGSQWRRAKNGRREADRAGQECPANYRAIGAVLPWQRGGDLQHPARPAFGDLASCGPLSWPSALFLERLICSVKFSRGNSGQFYQQRHLLGARQADPSFPSINRHRLDLGLRRKITLRENRIMAFSE